MANPDSGKTISITTIFVFQDDSITKATSGGAGNIGEFNPFTGTEMVGASLLLILFSCYYVNGCSVKMGGDLFDRGGLSPSLLPQPSLPSCTPLWSRTHR